MGKGRNQDALGRDKYGTVEGKEDKRDIYTFLTGPAL